MNNNELSVGEYVFFALVRKASEDVAKATRAFIEAAPTVRPDLSQVSRGDLRGAHGAYYQKIIPLNKQALESLEKDCLGSVESQGIQDDALITVSKRIAHARFYGEDPNLIIRGHEEKIDEHVFESLAELVVKDGFEKEVGMARAFVDAVRKVEIEFDLNKYRRLQIPAMQVPEVVRAFEELKDEFLTGRFTDTLKANPLIALEQAAVSVASSYVRVKPVQRVATVS